jgi:imidazolonepropionase-like amidohydrolase
LPRAPARWLAAFLLVSLHAPYVPAAAFSSDSGDSLAAPLPLSATRHIRFTTSEGTWMSVDASPDGRRLVFDLLGRLYLLPVEGGEATPITDGSGWDCQPKFSPDGQHIAFISDRGGSDNVWVIDANGADPREVTFEKAYLLSSPIWLPNQTAIVARRAQTRESPDDTRSMEQWIYPLDGHQPHAIAATKAAYVASGATVDSEGTHLFFARREVQSTGGPWELVQSAIPARTTVSLRGLFPQSTLRAVVSHDGNWLAYVVQRGERLLGHTTLRVRNLRTGADREVARPRQRPDDFYGAPNDLLPGFSFAPGDRAIYATAGGHIHRYDLASGRDQVIPFTAHVDQLLAPLVRTTHALGDSLAVHEAIGYQYVGADAEHGPRLLFSAVGRIWLLADGASTPMPLTPRDGLGSYAFDPRLSPDGRWVGYVTAADSTGGHVWKVPVDGGTPRRLDESGGSYSNPVWSADGSRIVVVRRRGTPPVFCLSRLSAEGGPLRDFATLPAGTTGARFLDAGAPPGRISFVAFHVTRDDGTVWLADGTVGSIGDEDRIETSTWQVRGLSQQWELRPPLSNLAISPDGHWAFVRFDTDASVCAVPNPSPRPRVLVRGGGIARCHQVTVSGARDLQWIDDGMTLGWSYASHFYRVPLADVLASDDRNHWRVVDTPIQLTVPRPVPRGSLLIRGARVITMRGDEIVPNADILITAGRIAAVGPSGSLAVPGGSETLQAAGATVIPGLIDTHYHPFQDPFYSYPFREYELLFARGVTTVRDPNAPLGRFLESEAFAVTEAPLPRVFATGAGIMPPIQSVSSLTRAREIVRRNLDDGAVGLKQYMQPRRRQRQWLRMAAGESDVNITNEGADDAHLELTMVADGMTGIEHAPSIASLFHDVTTYIALSGTTFTPVIAGGSLGGDDAQIELARHPDARDLARTLWLYPDGFGRPDLIASVARRTEPGIALAMAQAARDVVRNGGRVSVGAHELSANLHQELRWLVRGGMTPLETLRCATQFGADGIGYGDELGSLAPGKRADLLVLNSNPLDDIGNADDIRYVLRDGIVYDAKTLDEIWPHPQPVPSARPDDK